MGSESNDGWLEEMEDVIKKGEEMDTSKKKRGGHLLTNEQRELLAELDASKIDGLNDQGFLEEMKFVFMSKMLGDIAEEEREKILHQLIGLTNGEDE